MPNTRIRDEWDPIIRQLKEDNPKWSARRIHKEIKELLDNGKLPPDPPSLPTVTRSLAEDYDEEPYQRFHWPEAIENSDGALPWEASAACLELMAMLDKDAAGYIRNARPTISTCRWYWRLCLAAPNLHPVARYAIAVTIATHKAAERPVPEGLDMWLAYGPWLRGKEEADKRKLQARKADYQKAVAREHNPIKRYIPRISIPVGPGATTPETMPALAGMFAGLKRLGFDVRITEKGHEKANDDN